MKTVGVVAGLMLVLAGGMAADKGNADATAVPSDVDRAAGIDGDLYDIGLLSSIFSLLASGNTQRAADGIGSELLTRVRLFDGYLERYSRPEDLPVTLARFGPVGGGASVAGVTEPAPRIVFPPDGARVDLAAATERSSPLVLKLQGGRAPFRWLANGKPLAGLDRTRTAISARLRELLGDREELDAILARGSAQAREIGRPTLDATYAALGLVR